MRILFCIALIICALALASHSVAQSQPQNLDRSNLPIRFIVVRYASAALIADLFGGQVVQVESYFSGGTGGNRGNIQGSRSQGGRNGEGGSQRNTSRNGYGGGRR